MKRFIEDYPVLTMIIITIISGSLLLVISQIIGITSINISQKSFTNWSISISAAYGIIYFLGVGALMSGTYPWGYIIKKELNNLINVGIYSIVAIIILSGLGLFLIKANLGYWPYVVIEAIIVIITSVIVSTIQWSKEE